MYSSVQREEFIINLTKDILTLFWPINFCGPEAQQELIKKIRKIKNILLTCFRLISVALILIWADIKEYFLCFQVYKYYFGKWSKLPYYTFVFTFPWLAFSSIRIPFMLIYGIMEIQMQVYLINQQIAEISEANEDKMRKNQNYQNKIFEKLQLCIKHHIILKR